MTLFWKNILQKNFRKVDALLDFLEIEESDRKNIDKEPSFSLNLPLRLARKIPKKTLSDPLLRQFLPLKKERKKVFGFSQDPLKEKTYKKEGKILQKYPKRVLLLCSNTCAMHCRFCFRKKEAFLQEKADFSKEIAFLKKNKTLSEVILSGGDPLSLTNEELKNLFDALEQIPHLYRIRFHTRFPIGIPERIDEGFLQILKNSSKALFFVLHTNHPRELDEKVFSVLKKVQENGASLLSQSVLLKGINDTENALKELFKRLINQKILPYYLHQLDKVEGTSHFETSEEKGLSFMKKLRKELPGFAIPKYVEEVSGEKSKVILL